MDVVDDPHCTLCGFMCANQEDYDITDCHQVSGPNAWPHAYRNRNDTSKIHPNWLGEELVRLFPEARNDVQLQNNAVSLVRTTSGPPLDILLEQPLGSVAEAYKQRYSQKTLPSHGQALLTPAQQEILRRNEQYLAIKKVMKFSQLVSHREQCYQQSVSTYLAFQLQATQATLATVPLGHRRAFDVLVAQTKTFHSVPLYSRSLYGLPVKPPRDEYVSIPMPGENSTVAPVEDDPSVEALARQMDRVLASPVSGEGSENILTSPKLATETLGKERSSGTSKRTSRLRKSVELGRTNRRSTQRRFSTTSDATTVSGGKDEDRDALSRSHTVLPLLQKERGDSRSIHEPWPDLSKITRGDLSHPAHVRVPVLQGHGRLRTYAELLSQGARTAGKHPVNDGCSEGHTTPEQRCTADDKVEGRIDVFSQADQERDINVEGGQSSESNRVAVERVTLTSTPYLLSTSYQKATTEPPFKNIQSYTSLSEVPNQLSDMSSTSYRNLANRTPVQDILSLSHPVLSRMLTTEIDMASVLHQGENNSTAAQNVYPYKYNQITPFMTSQNIGEYCLTSEQDVSSVWYQGTPQLTGTNMWIPLESDQYLPGVYSQGATEATDMASFMYQEMPCMLPHPVWAPAVPAVSSLWSQVATLHPDITTASTVYQLTGSGIFNSYLIG